MLSPQSVGKRLEAVNITCIYKGIPGYLLHGPSAINNKLLPSNKGSLVRRQVHGQGSDLIWLSKSTILLPVFILLSGSGIITSGSKSFIQRWGIDCPWGMEKVQS